MFLRFAMVRDESETIGPLVFSVTSTSGAKFVGRALDHEDHGHTHTQMHTHTRTLSPQSMPHICSQAHARIPARAHELCLSFSL